MSVNYVRQMVFDPGSEMFLTWYPFIGRVVPIEVEGQSIGDWKVVSVDVDGDYTVLTIERDHD